jgi:hypothetical protein
MKAKATRNRCDSDPQSESAAVAIRVSWLLSSFTNQTCPVAVPACAGNSVQPASKSKARRALGRLMHDLSGQARRFKQLPK